MCGCVDSGTQECLVIDPFNGSGTTGRVCMNNNRRYVGIDINDEYVKASRALFADIDITFNEVNDIQELI